MHINSKKGMTLIEVIVAMTVSMLLLGLLFSSFSLFRSSTSKAINSSRYNYNLGSIKDYICNSSSNNRNNFNIEDVIYSLDKKYVKLNNDYINETDSNSLKIIEDGKDVVIPFYSKINNNIYTLDKDGYQKLVVNNYDPKNIPVYYFKIDTDKLGNLESEPESGIEVIYDICSNINFSSVSIVRLYDVDNKGFYFYKDIIEENDIDYEEICIEDFIYYVLDLEYGLFDDKDNILINDFFEYDDTGLLRLNDNVIFNDLPYKDLSLDFSLNRNTYQIKEEEEEDDKTSYSIESYKPEIKINVNNKDLGSVEINGNTITPIPSYSFDEENKCYRKNIFDHWEIDNKLADNMNHSLSINGNESYTNTAYFREYDSSKDVKYIKININSNLENDNRIIDEVCYLEKNKVEPIDIEFRLYNSFNYYEFEGNAYINENDQVTINYENDSDDENVKIFKAIISDFTKYINKEEFNITLEFNSTLDFNNPIYLLEYRKNKVINYNQDMGDIKIEFIEPSSSIERIKEENDRKTIYYYNPNELVRLAITPKTGFVYRNGDNKTINSISKIMKIENLPNRIEFCSEMLKYEYTLDCQIETEDFNSNSYYDKYIVSKYSKFTPEILTLENDNTTGEVIQ